STSGRPYPYKVLCISSLHSKASDEVVRETLYREFKRFGDISVKVVHEPDERVAYVYFRSYEDARDAKHSKSRIIIYDKPVMVEAAYESVPSGTSGGGAGGGGASGGSSRAGYDGYSGGSGAGGGDRGGGGYYRSEKTVISALLLSKRSPVYDRRDHRGAAGDDHHEGAHGGGGRRYDNNRGGGGGYGHHHPPHAPPMPQNQHYPMRNHEGGGYNRREPPMHHHDHHHGGGGYMGGQPRGMNNSGHYNRFNNNAGPPGPPRQGPQGGGPSQDRPYENKKDKFPNYLHHIAPEDDPLATRTLFAGNLEVNITEEELRRIFGRFGTVEDIDIKRPPPGTGNAYAFVRFVNLDMASRAKTELSGQYIGKFQCKIGYGKVNPTNRIWIGGLGPWTTMAQLEREFDRFGSIKKIDWVKNEPTCYITFETVDAAQAAVKDMRGYPLGGPDRRLRSDFADAGGFPPPKKYADGDYEFGGGSGPGSVAGSQQGAGDYEYNNRPGYRQGSGGPGSTGPEEATTEVLPPAPALPPTSGHSTDINTSPSDSESRDGTRRRSNGNAAAPNNLVGVKTIHDVARRVPMGWQGSLILKNSSFPSKMYLTSGDLEAVESLMKDEDGKNQLRITQRLRLDQSKLDDVRKRITSSQAHGVFLAMPTSISSPQSSENGSSAIQSRPLRNLVSYLKQKEAAGVISLAVKEANGVLYAFPPCPFSTELLTKGCSTIEVDTKDDHLVVVVIRGGGTA
ncbi:unnamed protein product, partial [Allacma fusca]